MKNSIYQKTLQDDEEQKKIGKSPLTAGSVQQIEAAKRASDAAKNVPAPAVDYWAVINKQKAAPQQAQQPLSQQPTPQQPTPTPTQTLQPTTQPINYWDVINKRKPTDTPAGVDDGLDKENPAVSDIIPAASLKTNVELLTAARAWLGPETDGMSPEDLADAYKSEMRAMDNNTYSAGRILLKVYEAKENGDVASLQNFKTMRDVWAKVPAFWDKGGDGFYGFVENVYRGAIDPINIIGGGIAGKAATRAVVAGVENTVAQGVTQFSKSMLKSALFDMGAAGGLRHMQQVAEINANVTDQYSVGDTVGTAVVGGAVPLAIGATGRLGSWLTRKYGPKKDLAQLVDNSDMMGRSMTPEEAAQRRKGVYIFNKNTGESPMYVFDNDVDPAIRGPVKDADGNKKIFANLDAAVKEVERLQTKGKSQVFVEGVHFKDNEEAALFVQQNGRGLGSTNADDYVKVKATTDADDAGLHAHNALGRYGGKYQQAYLNEFMAMKRLNKLIDKETGNTGISFGDLAENAKNKEAVAEGFINDKAFRILKDTRGNYVGQEKIDVSTGVLEIVARSVQQLNVQGFNTLATARELGAYARAIRLQQLSRRTYQSASGVTKVNPITKAMEIDEDIADVNAFVDSINNDPVRAPVFKQFAQDFQESNKLFLAYIRDSGLISNDDMARMLQYGDMYVPIKRVDSLVSPGAGGKARVGSRAKTAIRPGTLKMMGADYIDPLNAYQQNLRTLVSQAHDNVVKIEMYKRINELKVGRQSHFIENVTNNAVFKQSLSLGTLEKQLKADGLTVTASGGGSLNTNATIQLYIKNSITEAFNSDKIKVYDPITGRRIRPAAIDWVLDDGKIKVYAIKDRILADSMQQMNGTYKLGQNSSYASMAEIRDPEIGLLSMLTKHSQFMQRVIVANPGFSVLTAAPIDMVTSWLMNPWLVPRSISELPIFNVINGVYRTLTDSKDYADFIANGGGLAGLRGDKARKSLRQVYREMGIDSNKVLGVDPKIDADIFDKIGSITDRVPVYKEVVGTFGRIADVLENAGRFNNWRSARARGLSMAESGNIAAKSNFNFRQAGSNQTRNEWVKTSLFLRAALNIGYQTVDSVTFAKDGGRAARLVKYGAYSGMLIAYAAYVRTEYAEEYKSIPEDIRARFHIIFMNNDDRESFKENGGDLASIGVDGYIKVAKDPLSAIVSGTVEKMWDAMETDQRGQHVMWEAAKFFTKGTLANTMHVQEGLSGILPPAAKTLLGVTTNNKFGDIPIMGEGAQSLFAEQSGIPGKGSAFLNAYAEGESHLLSGDTLGFPPQYVEYVIRSLGMTLADYTLFVMDTAEQSLDNKFVYEISRTPMLKRIYSEFPQRRTSYEDKLFKLQDELAPYMMASSGKLPKDLTPSKLKQFEEFNRRLANDSPAERAKMGAAILIKEATKEYTMYMREIEKMYFTLDGNGQSYKRSVDDLLAKRNVVMKDYMVAIDRVLKNPKTKFSVDSSRK